MLLVVLPRPLVPGPIRMRIHSLTVCFVIDPFAFVNVSVGVVQFALPVGLAVTPLTLVSAPIEPLLLAKAVTHPVHPLALVQSPALQLYRSFLDSHI